MAELLAELRPLKGSRRAYKYYGETTGPRYKSYLTDRKVTTDPDELAEEGESHRNHEHLIFSNCVANVGRGILLLEIRRTSPTRAKVVQLVEDDEKPRAEWRRRSAGSAVFDSNPDHNHWHFANFLSYSLRRVGSSQPTRRALKQSFCLEDVAKLRKSAGNRRFPKCPDVDARTGEMGITPGWGDVYWLGVQEQYIEVGRVGRSARLPRGSYWLECVVDPLKKLEVKTREHDTTRVRVRLK